ncbi:MAG: gluconate 2-dehydrogenase subunit 3 family protein, partial [Saprospiraceae bacterium]|nr:gluconate 2-dehydrogenase subunit 3 family protein [Saprospiraceae bacterium]
MDRRENLKVLITGTVATGFLLSTGCSPEDSKKAADIISAGSYGRTPEEIIVNNRLHADTFFTEKEKSMVSVISDIIIPKDDLSGSASESGVPDFIEFMMKDNPKFQLPMRGGLMWLENLSQSTFDRSFLDITPDEKITLIDKIAYPDTTEDDMMFGVKFFNLMRNLTCTGFFTSKMGIEDIGYVGNRPNQWDG